MNVGSRSAAVPDRRQEINDLGQVAGVVAAVAAADERGRLAPFNGLVIFRDPPAG